MRKIAPKRKMTAQIHVVCHDEQKERLERIAAQMQRDPSGAVRWMIDNYPLPDNPTA